MKSLREVDAAMHAVARGSPEYEILASKLLLISREVFDSAAPATAEATPEATGDPRPRGPWR